MNLALFSAKKELLESYIQTHDVDLVNSCAFGDTEQDNAILERVGHPVALNPTANMATFAKRHKYASIKKTDRVLDKIDDILKQPPQEIKSSFDEDSPARPEK
jgi:phosphoserine phosphatase